MRCTKPFSACRVPKLFGCALLSLFLVVILLVFGGGARIVTAAANNTVNFQARLMAANGAIVPDGTYNVEFKIYNAASSSGSSQGSCTGDSACKWVETRTGGDKLSVANGYLTANLGTITSLPSIDWDQELWLTMNIGGTGAPGWDGEMSPRLKLTAVPHALSAGYLATTNGSFRSTLGFVQPTANRTIQAPDESGTICIQNSSACGFALASGAGNYIQNQNSSDQTANFRISGTGQANTSLLAPLFDTAAAGTLSVGTTNATAITLSKDTTITTGVLDFANPNGSGGNVIKTTTGNLSIRANGTNLLTLNTSGAGTVNIGTDNTVTVNIGGGTDVARTINVGNPASGTADQTVTVGSQHSTSTTTIQGGSGLSAVNVATATNGTINLTAEGSGGVNALLGSDGMVIKTTTDTTTALQVLDSADTSVFSVNTSSGAILLGALGVTYSGFDGTIDTGIGGATLNLGTSAADEVNLGSSGAAVTIQGDATSTWQATSGSFTTTLSFAAPTANRSIALPDESGTVCLQSSSACGFVAGTASGFIQNTTSPQSANLYVQAASSGSVAGVFRANAAGAGNILELKNGAGTNIAVFGSTGAIQLQNSTNSTAAFQILAASGGGGNSIFRVDSTNERIAIGVISDPIAAKLNIATSSTVGLRVFQGGSSDVFQLANGTADVASVSNTGSAIFKTTTDSTTGFRIQNNAGTALFTANTTNSRIAIAQASATYTLDVAGDINSTTSLRVAGTQVCDSTGCVAKSGSGFYIHNQTTVQTANQYIQSASSSSITALFQGAASQSVDILQVQNSSATKLFGIAADGGTSIITTTTDTSTAFNIKNSTTQSVVNVKSDGTAGIGVAATSTFFGKNTIGATQDESDSGSLEGTRYTTPASAGATSVAWVYAAGPIDSAPNNKFRVGIYTNSGSNTPQTLVAQSAEATLAVGWNQVPISATLSNSTNYWIVAQTNGTSGSVNNWNYDSSGLTCFATQAYGSFPGTHPACGGTPAVSFSFYVTFGTADTALNVTNTGNVGIGTTSPTTMLDVRGNALFRNSSNSTTAFQIQNSSNVSQLIVDTTNSYVIIGPSAGSTTPTLFLPSKKTDAGDPTVVDGAMYYNSSIGSFRCGQATAWSSCGGGLLSANTTTSQQVNTTTTETNFNRNYSLPANYCVAGRVIRVTANGTYGTNTSTTPTLQLRVKLGSTSLGTTNLMTTASGGSGRGWNINFSFTCNAAPGGSAAVNGQGFAILGTNASGSSTTAAGLAADMATGGTTSIATNAAQTLQVSADWGTSHANNNIIMRSLIVESLGPAQ